MPTENTTEEVIANAIDDATMDVSLPEEVADEPASTPEPAAVAPAAEPVAAKSGWDAAKELETHGFRAPQKGERENRIPYSRTQKILENARKKWETEQATAAKATEARLQAAEQRAQILAQLDETVTRDPDRFMAALALRDPRYARYVQAIQQGATPAQAQAVAQQVPAGGADPQPEPDGVYPDGSRGYTPEGLQKLREWDARQLERRLEAKFDQQYGGIRKQYEARQQYEQAVAKQAPRVRDEMLRARETWGDLLVTHHQEILTALQTAPLTMTFEAVISKVLLPKIKADRDKIYQEALKKVDGQAKAGAPGASTSGPVDPSLQQQVGGEAATIGAIQNAIAQAKRRGILQS